MHLFVICGPTATGKTAMGAELAHQLGTELISADSRQVYRGLDLGTGKDLREYRVYNPPVPYHLIDIVEPEDGYSLFQYQRDCYGILDRLGGEGSIGEGKAGGKAAGKAEGRTADVMVMVGGTGMYLEAVLRRYRIANVPENPALRESLAGLPREELESELKAKDPLLAARSDLSSRKRIVRALEICEAGRSQTVEYSLTPEREFTFTAFATRMDRPALRARIDARLDARIAEGMVEEVEGLLKRGVSRERMQVLGMEYREISEYLAGAKTREAMIADLRHEIHMLAKRQETYFRGMERRGVPMIWLEPGQGAAAILEHQARIGGGHD